MPPTRGYPISILSGLASSPPCTDGSNNTAGEPAGLAGITLWMGPQGQGRLQQDSGGGQVMRAPHGRHRTRARAADTKRWAPLPAVLPPVPLTGQAQPHSQRQENGQDGTGMGAGRQAGSAEEAPRLGSGVLWSGLLQFHLGRQAAAHTSSKPLTDVRLGRMQTVQHGQAQTRGDRGDTEHGVGNKAGAMGLPNPRGQDKKNKIRTSCKMPICWVLSFSLS